MSGVHARLSASSAHRWLRCAPSANYKDDKGSQYAAAGTFAHDIAAQCLADDSISPSDFLLKTAEIDGFKVECDLEMVDAVRLYVDEINGDHQEGDEGWIEMALLEPLKRIDKDLGGTADYVRYRAATKHLKVWDFKFGSGVFVDVDDNEQLKVYALGVLLKVEALGKTATDIEICVVQPRFEGADPVRSYKFKAVELLDFAADIAEAAVRSRDPASPFAAGDHCKFCPHAKACPELEKRQHSLVAADFGPLVKYDLTAFAKALADIPMVKERIKALEEFAYAEALRGVDIPGFKLVDKRANRKWKSEGDAIMWAQERAIDPYAPREVISPAQMEKKLAETAPRGQKKKVGEQIAHLVEKVSSGVALVPITDDRAPAKLVTAQDFPAFSIATGDGVRTDVSFDLLK